MQEERHLICWQFEVSPLMCRVEKERVGEWSDIGVTDTLVFFVDKC